MEKRHKQEHSDLWARFAAAALAGSSLEGVDDDNGDVIVEWCADFADKMLEQWILRFDAPLGPDTRNLIPETSSIPAKPG